MVSRRVCAAPRRTGTRWQRRRRRHVPPLTRQPRKGIKPDVHHLTIHRLDQGRPCGSAPLRTRSGLRDPQASARPGCRSRRVGPVRQQSSYLVEHITSNVVGAVLAIWGTLALGAFLSRGRAPRLALSGTVLAVAGHILFMVPGTISTFATPAIGAAYLSGNSEVMAMAFSPVLTLTIGVALLLAVAGNTIIGLAIWRSRVLPKWAGLMWIAAALIFYVLGAFLGMATTGASLPTQPVGAVLMTLSSAWIAWTVLRHRSAQALTNTAI